MQANDGQETWLSQEARARLPDAQTLSDLTSAEAMLVVGLRMCSSVHLSHAELASAHWRRCGVAGALRPAQCLMHLFEVVAGRSVGQGPEGAAALSIYDKRLLCAVALLQQSRPLEAFDVLIACLPGAAVRLALGFCETLADACALTGLFFPDRAWSLAEQSSQRCLRPPVNAGRSVRYSLH